MRRSPGTSLGDRARCGGRRPLGRARRFGLDSLIEILASLVVVWQLQDMNAAERERRALRIIGVAFLLLATYISVQSIYVLVTAAHPRHSLAGIVWLALTAAAMFVLAAAKHRTGRALGSRVVQTEARGP